MRQKHQVTSNVADLLTYQGLFGLNMNHLINKMHKALMITILLKRHSVVQ